MRASILTSVLVVALATTASAQEMTVAEGEAVPDPRLAAILAPATYGTAVSRERERRRRLRPSWPNRAAARIGGIYGRLDWAGDDFEDRNETINVPASALRLGRVDLVGVEAGLELAILDHLRFGSGVSFLRPVAGQVGGEPLASTLGDRARVEGVHVVQWWGELGVAHRFGDLTLIATAHVGWLRTIVDLESGCECPELVRSTRVTAGPHLGLRAHVWKALFVQAGARADALRWPDYMFDLSVGVGHRRH